MDGPFISICIPAYKNITYLQRLLDSIAMQTYTKMEVIVTDDSPDESVRSFIESYQDIRSIQYFRNVPALGTPENWNEAIRRAHGQWIKVMHDDDWFAHAGSLAKFAEAAAKQPDSFLFSAYTNHFLETGKQTVVQPSNARLKWLSREPYTLLSKNIIGPPSVTMHRKDSLYYDKQTKWVVDIDYYIRRLKTETFHYISEPLVNVGMSSQQVTVDCINNRKIQVPENFHLLNKVGVSKLANPLIYDAWWRLIRNLEITRLSDIAESGYTQSIPAPVSRIIDMQRHIPRPLLTNGLFSKSSMFVHYLLFRNKLGN